MRRLREGYEFFKSMSQRRTDLAGVEGGFSVGQASCLSPYQPGRAALLRRPYILPPPPSVHFLHSSFVSIVADRPQTRAQNWHNMGVMPKRDKTLTDFGRNVSRSA